MNFIKSVFFLTVILLFTSCSVSKHLGEGMQVHVKTKMKFNDPKIIKNKNEVEVQINEIAQPKPATGFAKWQTNLYNKYSKVTRRDSTGKALGIRGWALRKIGLPPVIFDARKVNQSRIRIQKYFNDNGYFGTAVKVDTTLRKKEVTVQYDIYPKDQYHIRNIHLPNDSIKLIRKIYPPGDKSLLVSGAPYQQNALTAERERLSDFANDLGFLHVNEDHFYYFVDTTLNSRQVDIYLKIRQPKDSTVFQVYHLNQNIVYATYSLSIQGEENDTTDLNNFKIIQKKNIVRPKILAKIIAGAKGELYSKKIYDNALTRLLDLGIYKFVNLKIEPQVSDSSFLFDRNFYLTPGLMQDISAEFEAISRSTSYFGIASSVTYSHRNIFHGAERLDVRVSGGVGTQTNQTENLINTLDGAFEISLTLPRLITPFKLKSNRGPYIPKTRISIGNDYQRRIEYYTVNSFLFKYGFEWSKTKNRQHQFYPININQFNVRDITDAMRELFLENPRLERSFDNVFILGFFYNYTLSTQSTNTTKPYFYLRAGFETSGNLTNILISTLDNQKKRPYELFGSPFSQFVRLDGDFRYYFPLKKGLLAGRFISGIGIPYKNSELLPYIKQYFIGGPSSIRAFQFRALGPGSFAPKNIENNNFIEQTGDMRLELNLEYRFPIISYFKGALFVDSGNIWLLKDTDNSVPEGVFDFNRFYKEIAVGAGFGFRLDLNFLVVRLDAAIPLRIPYLEENNRWVISDIDFTSKAWRKANIQWNFAIGYPF